MNNLSENDNPSTAVLLAAITEMRATITTQITETQNKIVEGQDIQEAKNVEIHNNLKVHDQKLNRAYKRDIKKNLVIYGLEEALGKPMWTVREKVLDLLTNKLLIKDIRVFDIHDIRTAGAKKNVLIATLCSPQLVQMAISSSMKLKGTKIAVDFDLSAEERAQKKQLLAFQRDFRSRGRECKMRKNTLVVGSETFTLQQLLASNPAVAVPGASGQTQAVGFGEPTQDVEDSEMSDATKKRTPPERDDRKNTKKFILNPPKIPHTPSKFTQEMNKEENC